MSLSRFCESLKTLTSVVQCYECIFEKINLFQQNIFFDSHNFVECFNSFHKSFPGKFCGILLSKLFDGQTHLFKYKETNSYKKTIFS